MVLDIRELTKTYASAGRELTVLDHVSFQVAAGESVAIIGPSGSGKTTLLGLCAGLDVATSGSVSLLGQRLDEMDEDQRARLRNERVGFVFQNFQLLPTLTALENVMVPAELRGDRDIRRKAIEWLERVGLADRAHHYPSQLSGGEQQRVAVARAFVTSPSVLFADEPTGNLDESNAAHVTELLFSLNRDQGTTLILITHNLALAGQASRVLEMKGGRMIHESTSGVR